MLFFFYDQAAHFFGYILSGAMNLLFLVTQSVVNDTYDAHTQQSRKKTFRLDRYSYAPLA